MVTARVLGTGVELVLAEDSPLGSLYAASTPEEREERWGGSWHGTRVVDLRTDPTSALLDIAADGETGDILGDLHIAELDVARFSFHAAPHRIELSDALRARIEAAGWRL